MTNRRRFLYQAAGISTLPLVSVSGKPFARLANKNSKLRYALIGAGGNGTRTAPVAQQFVDMVAICDVDSKHLADGNELLTGGKADEYRDYQEVLVRDDIDVVHSIKPLPSLLTDGSANSKRSPQVLAREVGALRSRSLTSPKNSIGISGLAPDQRCLFGTKHDLKTNGAASPMGTLSFVGGTSIPAAS